MIDKLRKNIRLRNHERLTLTKRAIRVLQNYSLLLAELVFGCIDYWQWFLLHIRCVEIYVVTFCILVIVLSQKPLPFVLHINLIF